METSWRSRVFPAVVASLTLGLAPYFPEPHLVGKLRWVAGGAVGMQAMDWGDLLMHGAPWAVLAVTLAQWGVHLARRGRASGAARDGRGGAGQAR